MWTRVTWLWLESDSSHKYDYLQLDFDFNINDSWLNLDLRPLTRLDLIPPKPKYLKWCYKKSVPRINSSFNRLQFESDSSQSNCASWEKVVRGSAGECRRVNSDGALGKMIPKCIIFGYKDNAVSTKNGLQLAKHAGRKWQTEAHQPPTLFDIWSCTRNTHLKQIHTVGRTSIRHTADDAGPPTHKACRGQPPP